MNPEIIPVIEQLIGPLILTALENEFGLTAAQTLTFYALSEQENPQFTPDERAADVAGKFKHAWRTGDVGPVREGYAEDIEWPYLQGFVVAFVNGVIAQMPAATRSVEMQGKRG